MKRTLAVLALVALPSIASAFTVSAINDYTSALAQVNPIDSLDLPGTWTDAPLTIIPDASVDGVIRSPFEEAGHNSAGYYSVGTSEAYSGTNNPAVLQLTNRATNFSLLWGSPDSYNTLELYDGATLVASILGSQFSIPAYQASFVSISAGAGESFTSAKFYSDGNAFEFSNVSAVPIPAAAWLFGSGLIALAAVKRRKR